MARPSAVPFLRDPDSPRPFFSIITVCRNAEACIETTARSVLAQTCLDWEWIVVDGASSDGTVAKIREMAGTDPKVWIQSEMDSGIFNAMNKGVHRCRGIFVHFLNADDSYADARVLEEVKAEILANEGTNYLYGDIIVKTPGQPDWLERAAPVSSALDSMVCGCLPHQATFASRDLFVSYPGLFDESLRTSGDYKWMMQAVSSPMVKLHHMDRFIAHYMAGGASAQLEKSLPESFKVLNGSTEFLEAVGTQRLLAAYQAQILNLRVQLEKLHDVLRRTGQESDRRRDETMRAKAKTEEVKSALQKTKTKLQETKAALQKIKLKRSSRGERGSKESPSPSGRLRWLPRWLRPKPPRDP